MTQVIGHLIVAETGASGTFGIVDVQGARIKVPLLLTPDAMPGDILLVDAGVAVAVVERRSAASHHDEGT
jgi:hydrogenase maturation factor